MGLVPSLVRHGVTNFFNNAEDLWSAVNNLLRQFGDMRKMMKNKGKMRQMMKQLGGMGGLGGGGGGLPFGLGR